MFLKNKNIIFKTRGSKVTDYAALSLHLHPYFVFVTIEGSGKSVHTYSFVARQCGKYQTF